jgi:uncharacterized protein (TIGR03067 family)
MYRIILTPALALVLVSTGLSARQARKPDELQGAWTLVSVEAEAGAIGLPDPRPGVLIKGDSVIYGGEVIARMSTDATTDPKVLDLRFPKPDRVYEGVYAVAKDSLKICLNGRSEGVKERPGSFAVKGHPAWRLLSFERVKGGDAGPGNGFVGLALRLNKSSNEIVVNETLADSPAKKAGLLKDDIVVEVGGVRVTDLRSAIDAVRRAKPRDELAFRIRRNGKEREVKVKVGLLPFSVLAGLES